MSEVAHRDFSAKERKNLASKGQAMPGGGFPIRNSQDLKNAIQAYGRAANKPAAKAWIIRRAKALGLTDLLPDGWLAGDAKQMSEAKNFLEHFGIKGMRWGVRRSRKELAREAQSRTGKSVKDMSDDELRSVINRLNMEQQYIRLTSGGGSSSRTKKLVAAGATFASGIALNIARNQIQNAANAKIAGALQNRPKLSSVQKARKAFS